MPDNQQEKINERVIKLRKRLGYTQKQFADAIGYRQGHISEIEKGIKNISKGILYAIYDSLSVNREWMETGNGEMFIQTGENNLDKSDIHYNEDSLSFKHRNRLHENDMQYKVTEFIDLAIPLKGRTEKAHLSLPADYTDPDLKRIIKFIEALT